MQVKHKNVASYRLLFSLKFFTPYNLASLPASASITSSQIIGESSIILAKYFPFSQLHVLGF